MNCETPDFLLGTDGKLYRVISMPEDEIFVQLNENQLAVVEEREAKIKELQDEVARLTEQLHYANGTGDLAMKHRDTAEADNARLRAALKPFAKSWWTYQDPAAKVSVVFNHNPYDERDLCTVGDIHRARAALKDTTPLTDQEWMIWFLKIMETCPAVQEEGCEHDNRPYISAETDATYAKHWSYGNATIDGEFNLIAIRAALRTPHHDPRLG